MKFREVIKQNKPTLVDFFASWCGPCKMMSPVLEDVKKRMGDRVTIIKVDVDESPDASSTFGVQGVPTLILFKNGKIIWRKAGVVPAGELEKIINANA